MPPRFTPPPKSSTFPANDSATFRDLLLFEERLKTTAVSLQKRKSRYQLFLIQLLLVTLILSTEVLLPRESSFLVIPYRLFLLRFLPTTDPPDTLPSILPTTLLFVCAVTLILFFASGMYSEKIGYANKYVPHANRALRSFNMYLNVRKPSRFRNPLSFFFARPKPPVPHLHTPAGRRNSSVPIPPIPPSTNPRGELIFSSRVDKNFRESYERHRNTFERKREERARMLRKQKWWGKLMFWDRAPPAPPQESLTHSRTSTLRGRTSRTGTPPIGEKTGSPLSMGQQRMPSMIETIGSGSRRSSTYTSLESDSD